jgi:hypothetical protein
MADGNREEAIRWWTWALYDSWPRRHYSPSGRQLVWDTIAALRYFRDFNNHVLGAGWPTYGTQLYRAFKAASKRLSPTT